MKAIYTNHRGETAERNIEPLKLMRMVSPYYADDGPQWILRARDIDRGAVRDFALMRFDDQSSVAYGAIRHFSSAVCDADSLDELDQALRAIAAEPKVADSAVEAARAAKDEAWSAYVAARERFHEAEEGLVEAQMKQHMMQHGG